MTLFRKVGIKLVLLAANEGGCALTNVRVLTIECVINHNDNIFEQILNVVVG